MGLPQQPAKTLDINLMHEKTTWISRVPVCALLIIAVLALTMVTITAFVQPLGFDEAYNLQVVENIARGVGYASFGVLRGDGPWFFDPYVTTGPTVLLPLAFAWWATGGSIFIVRLLMVCILWLYVFALERLTSLWYAKRLSFAISVGALSALMLSTYAQIGNPGAVVGELPGAMLVLWGAYFLCRQKYFVASLILGLAVQTKAVYLVPCVALLVCAALLIAWRYKKTRTTIRIIGAMAFVAILPTLLFELYRLQHFGGIIEYLHSIDELRRFVWTQTLHGQNGDVTRAALYEQKILALYGAVPMALWIALLACLLFGIAVRCTNLMERWRQLSFTQPGPRLHLLLIMGAIFVGGAAIFVIWVVSSRQVATRQVEPTLLLCIPLLAIWFATALRTLVQNHSQLASSSRVVRLVACAPLYCISACLVWPVSQALAEQPAALSSLLRARDAQLKTVKVIAESNASSIFVDGWWQDPEFQILAGIRAVPIRSGYDQLQVVTLYQAKAQGRPLDSYSFECAGPAYQTTGVLVCKLRHTDAPFTALHVEGWGPQSAPAGFNPNRLQDGTIGIWVKIDQSDVENLGPLELEVGRFRSIAAQVHADRALITASLACDVVRREGDYPVFIRRLATGRRTAIGTFRVTPPGRYVSDPKCSTL